VVVLAVLAALGIGFIEPWRKAVTDFTSCKKRQVQAIVKPPVKNVPLKSATASTEFGNHEAFDAFDSSPETFWQAGPPGSAPLPLKLTVEFVEPATVRQIHFFPGLPEAVNKTSHPTPKTVLMTFKNAEGKTVGKEERIGLETNVAKPDQLLKLKSKKNVRSVEIAILDEFPAQGGGTQIAISDVQFFGSPAQASGAKCNVS
jgi:hypothetical protein